MKNRDKEPLFGISVTSRLLGVTPRTLRIYEEADLISPYRTEGNTRLYSERDIRKLQVICYLHKEREVNLSGIKIILEIITSQPAFNSNNSDSTREQKDAAAEKREKDVIAKIREIAPELLSNIFHS